MRLRSLGLWALVFLVPALSTADQETGKSEAKKPSAPGSAAKSEAKKPSAPGAAAKSEAPLALSPSAVTPAQPAASRVNLFNSDVLGRVAKDRRGRRGGKEKSPGLRFGNDTWKSHVKQIGGMVAGFAALSALCAGSRCMLPKGLTSWMPGTTKEAPPAPARVGPKVKGMPKLR